MSSVLITDFPLMTICHFIARFVVCASFTCMFICVEAGIGNEYISSATILKADG